MLVVWQHVGLLVSSFLNALLSAACCVGLVLAISLTISGNGRSLMVGCNSTSLPISPRSAVTADCPFDTTRIYVSPLPSPPLRMGWGLTLIWVLLKFPQMLFAFKHITRWADTTLALWFPSALLAAVEAGISMWCFIVGLILRGLGPCAHTYLREQLEEEAMAIREGPNSDFTPQGQQLIGHQSVQL
ncbi:hypothetical protein JZ751_010469 [Albula glossodonta]|uniref:Uncharacterized protein n=1 Tax=Albula glossodonta TaxID=121402 RepID=A0A8T2P5A1_9TELE|nr:hypothetical protein JZ751_010469 [Albula glossodonta]